MAPINDPNAASVDEPVVAVVKVKIDSIDASELLAEAIEVLSAESRQLQGFLTAQILLSIDRKTMVIITEWSDHHAWAQSRYDARVGKMIEHCHTRSTTIEFELYTRPGEFQASKPAE